MAFATAKAFGLDRFSIYENGVTSLNFQRREDLLNARSSRTTHPKTLSLLQELFSMINGAPFTIVTPYLTATKADVLHSLRQSGGKDLIDSSVSCSGAFKAGPATHCGECFQCLERRLACRAAGVGEEDPGGLYATDTFTAAFSAPSARTVAVDYVAQAIKCASLALQAFEREFAAEIAEAEALVPGNTYSERVSWLWDLYRRHGEAVRRGIGVLQAGEDLASVPVGNTFLRIVGDREFLKTSAERLADRIVGILVPACQGMFRGRPPESEPDMNQKVAAVLATHYQDLRSEFPTTPFACASVIPDHTVEARVLVESKYIRTNTSPAKVNEGIAADCTKYPPDKLVVFLILDLDLAIKDDVAFKGDFEARRPCRIVIVR